MTNKNADNIENIYFSNTAIDMCLRIEETSINPQEQKLEDILSQSNEVRVSQLANMIQKYFPNWKTQMPLQKKYYTITNWQAKS